jgi:hypothetical protein
MHLGDKITLLAKRGAEDFISFPKISNHKIMDFFHRFLRHVGKILYRVNIRISNAMSQ